MKWSVVLAMFVVLTSACNASVGRVDSASTPVDSTRQDSATAMTDDCVRGEPEPVLTSGNGARVPRFERTGKLGATEDLKVDDTTSLRLTHGGCAHYTETYAFTIRGATRDTTDSDYWLERGATLLRSLPVGDRRTGQIDQLAKTLVAEAAEPLTYTYGDPISIPELTTVTLSVARRADGVVLEIVYDVAL